MLHKLSGKKRCNDENMHEKNINHARDSQLFKINKRLQIWPSEKNNLSQKKCSEEDLQF